MEPVVSEWMPQESSLLARPMAALTAWAVRSPVWTLVAAGVVALLCLGVSSQYLRLHTARSDLINPQSQYHRYWLEYTEEFTDQEDVVLVVEGQRPEEVASVADELVAALEKHPQYFASILHRMDFSRLQAKGLYYLPLEQLEKLQQGIQEAAGRVKGFQKLLSQISDKARPRPSEEANPAVCRTSAPPIVLPPPVVAKQPSRFFLPGQSRSAETSWKEGLVFGSGPWIEPALLQSQQYFGLLQGPGGQWLNDRLQSSDGRQAFILLRLVKDKEEKFARNSEQIDALRRTVAAVGQQHPEVQIGLTGLPIIENDEMRASEVSSARASIVALLGVMFVFVMGFGGLRHPMLANAALMCGMVWATGFTTVSIGRLNILSIAFAAILIGQGADFGIYYIARYLQLRKTAKLGPTEALIETGRTAGPSIADGALGTAAAFLMAGLTDFQGVAELGIIAGGGLILCWLATMVVLPAMVRLVDGWGLFRRLPEPLDLLPYFRPLYVRPRWTLAVVLLITAGLSLGIGRLWYDHNLFHLLPAGLESVELERRLVAQTDKAVYYALSIAETPEEVLERKKQFLKLPSVDRVEEIASILAPEEQKKQPCIARIHYQLKELSGQIDQLEQQLADSLSRLSTQLGPKSPGFFASSSISASTNPLSAGSQVPIEDPRATSRICVGQSPGGLPLGDCSEGSFAHLATSWGQQIRVFREFLERLAAISDPEPPRLEDLPRSLTDRFVGRHGRHLMKVYSKADIWDLEGMTQFVRELRTVDPRTTGNPIQIYEASRQMKQSFLQAALYASLVIVPLLLFDFRNLRHTFWAILPLLLGMIQMFGLLGLLNIPLNPANMIVLPIILGIGIDNGVHIVHDFLQQGRSYRGMSPSTCMAIVINSLCNMVGFGSLMIASHQGLQSLGRVLTIGMGCILANSLVLPNLLLMYQHRQKRQTSHEQQVPSLATIPDVSDEPTQPLAETYRHAA